MHYDRHRESTYVMVNRLENVATEGRQKAKGHGRHGDVLS